jgi:hypothetical protein
LDRRSRDRLRDFFRSDYLAKAWRYRRKRHLYRSSG